MPMSPIPPGDDTYLFCLYVAGRGEPQSLRAIETFYQMADLLPIVCELEVVDIFEQIELAEAAKITAIPTLVKQYPPPVQKFVGELSDPNQVLSRLKLRFSS